MKIPTLAILATLVISFQSATPSAQVARALIREGDPLPSAPTETVSSIGNTSATEDGFFGVSLNSNGPAGALSHVWYGDRSGGSIVRTEGTIGGLIQTGFESFFGVSSGFGIAYSPSSNQVGGGATGLDGVWNDDTVIALEGQPIASLAGKEWRFASRPNITDSGLISWVGGINDQATGTNEGGGLFASVGGVEVNLVKTGDVIGTLLPLEGTAIDFDVRFSSGGTSWIGGVDTLAATTEDFALVIGDVASGSVVPIDVNGGAWIEGEPMTAMQGGLATESWDNFDFFGITESGSWMVTGDTDGDPASDEFVAVDGVIRYREGDVLDGRTLTGSIEGADLAEDGRVAILWDVVMGTSSLEALILDDHVLLVEGDLVDWDGDGFVDADATLVNFTGIASLTLGSDATIAFTADVDVAGVDREAFFLLEYDCVTADVHALSTATGGTQNLSLDAGPSNAGLLYLMLGSGSGTQPGFSFQGVAVPLNIDGHFNAVINQANSPTYTQSFGALDAEGRSETLLNLPGGSLVPSGLTVHHAFATFSLAPITLTKVSGAIPLSILP